MRVGGTALWVMRVWPVSVYENGSYSEKQSKKDISGQTSHWVPVMTAVLYVLFSHLLHHWRVD